MNVVHYKYLLVKTRVYNHIRLRLLQKDASKARFLGRKFSTDLGNIHTKFGVDGRARRAEWCLGTLGAQGVIRKILTMGKWGRVISLALILALSWLAALSVTNLRIDRSDDNLISPDHAGWPAYNQMTADFGIESSLLIYARAGDLWTQARLRQLEDVVIALGDLPDVISVDSIFTATNIRDKGDFVDAGPLVDMVPDDLERIAELKADALYSPVLVGNVISADGEGTAIAVTFKDNPEDADHGLKVFEDVERVIAPLHANFDPVFQVGGPRLMVEIDQGLFSDLAVLVPAAMGILILTTLLFLRWKSVV